MKSELINTVAVLLYLPVRLAVSPMSMNRNARVMDAPAPVAAVYSPHMRIMMQERILFAAGLFPKTERMDDNVA